MSSQTLLRTDKLWPICSFNFRRQKREKGALIAPTLKLGDEGRTVVIVEEYKDLLQTTKVVLRTSRRLVKREPKDLIPMIGNQNHGLVVSNWRMIGSKRGDDGHPLDFIIHDLSTWTLRLAAGGCTLDWGRCI